MSEAKKFLLLGGLQEGMTGIVLDARTPGVKVPNRHATNPALKLDLSWKFGPRFPLAVDDEGITATLAFPESFTVVVPWEAVYKVGAYVFPDACPDVDALGVEPEKPTPKARPSHLRVVK